MRLWPLALAVALALGALACDPDLPGRACTTDDDCFRDEICQGTSCVGGARGEEADAGADAASADAAPDEESG